MRLRWKSYKRETEELIRRFMDRENNMPSVHACA